MTVTVGINVSLDVFQKREPHYAASARVLEHLPDGVAPTELGEKIIREATKMPRLRRCRAAHGGRTTGRDKTVRESQKSREGRPKIAQRFNAGSRGSKKGKVPAGTKEFIWRDGEVCDARPHPCPLPRGEGDALRHAGKIWALAARSPSRVFATGRPTEVELPNSHDAANVSPSPRGRGLG